MDKLINETRVILIGGSSHAGKSTLSRSLATKLGWSYRSTDKLARHPGRPWADANGKTIPDYVAQHYKTLSVEALFLDVLSHYEKNVLPQIEAIVHSHASDLSNVVTLDQILKGKVGRVQFQPSDLSTRTKDVFTDLLAEKYKLPRSDQ